MEPMTLLIVVAAAIAVIGLAWVGGYQIGRQCGISAERELADRRINGLLAQENARKPKSQKAKRKAARKASLA